MALKNKRMLAFFIDLIIIVAIIQLFSLGMSTEMSEYRLKYGTLYAGEQNVLRLYFFSGLFTAIRFIRPGGYHWKKGNKPEN